MLLAAERAEQERHQDEREEERERGASVILTASSSWCLLLTVAPELGLEPAWSGEHGPASGAVGVALRLPEGHGRKHVRLVVAVVAQVDLRAHLEAAQHIWEGTVS